MIDPSSSLQIPESFAPGPSSRQYRPVSVSAQPTTSSPQASSRKRASHSVATSNQQAQQEKSDDQLVYRDVYSHPAAVAYAAAHPRRTIPKFGPYLLLQTLGEGEFGKVKLGLHSQWGEEVAVKLIRRGNIDTTLRMSKVEREIEVLRTLKHPNIVRLYDVIETDKYIGIILEYASGGELFDHILAHRYLKEKDAAKLFSQLISGVWYIHQKKIVHRDLKLENLLLDRHRNVIITDFGFANRFEHRADDLMQTSCGSPCYAAPELVISEGLYVGSAVDIWSCGVILYAMLAGYLPFDDDPANPDGDNINLLYKYIVNTPLSFPDYISLEARDLLLMMLVPDPTRRADLQTIMSHEWLTPFAHVFAKQVDELERAAMEQHQMKRLAYQRQMKQAAAAAAEANNRVARTQSARADVFSGPSASAAVTRSTTYKNSQLQQPEYLYETSVDQSMNSSHSPPVIPSNVRKGNSATIVPTATPLDDDPFAPSPPHDTLSPSIPIHVSAVDEVEARGRGDQHQRNDSKGRAPAPAATPSKPSPETAKKKGAFRHTIQVEYVQDATPTQSQSPPKPVSVNRKQVPDVEPKSGEEQRPGRVWTTSPESATRRKPSVDDSSNVKHHPSTPSPSSRKHMERDTPPQLPGGTVATALKAGPAISIAAATPPATPFPSEADKCLQTQIQRGTGSTGSRSSRQSGKHHRGLSVDKLGLGKIFGSAPSVEHVHANGIPSRVPSHGSAAESGVADDKPSNAPTPSSDASLSNPVGPATKKSRRNTLTIMVEPLRQTIKGKKGKAVVGETATNETPRPPLSAMQPPPTPNFTNASKTDIGMGMGIPASTNKANRVMQWFRSRSKGPAYQLMTPGPADEPASDLRVEQNKEHVPPTPTQATYKNGVSSSINQDKDRSPRAPQRTASTGTDASFSPATLANRVRRSVGVAAPTPAKGVLRVHHGAVAHSMITTRPPPEVMKHVRDVLEGMGVDIRLESEFKYRCIRLKKKKTGTGVGLGLRDAGSGNGLAAFNMIGSAASNGVDKRGLPVPSSSSFSATGGMLKGLLMRRQSSQVSTSGMASQPSLSLEDDNSPAGSPVAAEPSSASPQEPLYGDSAQDAGDEVRFSVELTRLDRLNDTFSLDIRRLKGNLRSYKFLYDTLRVRADLQR